jgi:hypothetical protein
MILIVCPEVLVTNYHPMPRNIAEEQRPEQHWQKPENSTNILLVNLPCSHAGEKPGKLSLSVMGRY